MDFEGSEYMIKKVICNVFAFMNKYHMVKFKALLKLMN